MDAIYKPKTGPSPKDMRGERFERLVVEKYLGSGRWVCLCDCGEVSTHHGADLRRGRIRSCGCLQLEIARTGDCRRTHGMSYTPEYSSWSAMINRCTNSKAMGYEHYGGRGITVCDRWMSSVEDFCKDMGARPPGTTIERQNVNGNYEPGNCRWATPQEQAENTRRTILVTANGKTQSLTAWGRELGVSDKTIRYRLSQGMTHDEAINTPFRAHKRW